MPVRVLGVLNPHRSTPVRRRNIYWNVAGLRVKARPVMAFCDPKKEDRNALVCLFSPIAQPYFIRSFCFKAMRGWLV